MKTKNKLKFELSAILVTTLGKFVFMDLLNLRLYFVLTAVLFWSAYIFFINKKEAGYLKDWGFRTDNIYQVLKSIAPFFILSFICCLLVGDYLNTINVTWHILPILLLYPLWGTIQQFLILALVSNNLKKTSYFKEKQTAVLLISACLFSIIHYPHPWLMIGTFVLALFYTFIYLQNKNLFVLGTLHGWLGAIFFYTVVDRDPYLEIFGHLTS